MADLFQDRTEAGLALAGRLRLFAGRNDVLVLALPRGGVVVGCEVARELRAPLDVFLVHKLPVPFRDDLAMGAITSGSVLVLNDPVLRTLDISERTVREAGQKELPELLRRENVYRGDRPRPDVQNRILILIDDGLANGVAMLAAVAALRPREPAGIIVAVPVALAETCAGLEAEVEQVVCLESPEPFFAVGLHYRHFPRVTDEEVRDILEQSAAEIVPAAGSPAEDQDGDEESDDN